MKNRSSDRRGWQTPSFHPLYAVTLVVVAGCNGARETLPDARPEAVRAVAADALPDWATPPLALVPSTASKQSARDPREIDIGAAIAQVSNAFRRLPSSSSSSSRASALFASRGDAFRSELDGVGFRFSPDLPSRDQLRRWSRAQGYDTQAHDIARLPEDVSADPETSLRVRTVAVWQGKTRIDEISAGRAQWVVTGHVAQALRSRRYGLVEQVTSQGRHVEQRWALARRPEGSDPLTVEVELDGLSLDPRTENPSRPGAKGSLHLRDAEGRARVRYGAATLVAADGQRTPLRSEPTGQGLRITVSRAALAAAEFPIVIDPIIEPEFAIPSAESETRGSQRDPQIAATSAGALVVWEDVRDEPGSRLQITAAFDSPGGEQSGDQRDVALSRAGEHLVALYEHEAGIGARRINSALEPENHHDVAVSGEDPEIACASAGCLAVWIDGGDVFMAELGISSGFSVGDAQTVIADSVEQANPAVATNGRDFFVVWDDDRLGRSAVYGARVRDGAVVAADQGGFLLAASDEPQSYPRVASDGQDYRVVWDAQGTLTHHIVGLRVSAEDGPRSAAAPVSNYPDVDCRHPDIAFNGERFLNVFRCAGGVWASAQRIDGELVGQNLMSTDTDGLVRSYRPRVASDRDGEWLITYVHERSTVAFEHVLTTRVSPDGLAKERTVYFDGGFHDGLQHPTAVGLPTGGFLVAWDSPDGQGRAVEARPLWVRHTISGTRLREDLSVVDYDGFEFAEGGRAPALACDGDACLVAFESLRGEPAIHVHAVGVGSPPDAPGVGDNALTFSTSGARNNPAVAHGGDGFLVMWEDGRAGGPALFGARFDEAGQLVASDAGGVELVDGSARRTRPDVVFDGTDYRMVWTDGPADEATIQLATVDPETLAVSAQDIAIDDPNAAQVEGRIAALGNDQVLVVGTSSNDIARARRRAASRWLDGMAISLGRGSVSDAMGAIDGSHYLVAVGTHVGHTQLRFWRIDASGEVGDAFEHIHRDSRLNSRVSLMPFRDEFVVAFERWVRASEAVSVAFVDPAGSLHDEVVASKEWVDPSSLEAVQGNANHPAAAGIGDRYLAVWDYDRFDQGIYATRMRGEILEEVEPLAGVRPDRLWHDEVPIQVSSTGVEPDIACGDAQCLVVWRVDGDEDSHIRATFMNPFSAQVFSPNGVVIAGSDGAVGRPRVASNGDDFVAVWSDGGERIRSVEASTTSDLSSVQADIHSDVPGEERDPAVASDGSGFVVVWSREEDGTPTVVAQRTSSGGALHVVSSDPDGVGVPAIGHNGAGAYLAAWQHRDPTRARTRIALLGVDGERAGSPEGMDLERSCGSPSVGSRRGSNAWMVACLDTQTDSAAHAIEIARIETDLSISHRRRWETAEPHETHEVSVTGTRFGVLMLYTETQRRDGRDRRIIVANNYEDEPGQPLSVGSISDLFSVPSDQRNPVIATSDTQHLIVWEDTRGPGRTLWGTRLGFDGLVADPTGILIGERSSTINERSPAIASNGSDFLVAFTRDEAQPHIYAKPIDSTGRPSGEAVRLWNGDRPAVASDGQDYLVVHESGGSIGAHRISAEGASIGSGFTIIGEGGAIPGEGTSAAGRPTLAFSSGHYVLAYEAWYSTAGIGIVWLDPSGAKLDGFPRRLPGAGIDHDCPAVTGSAEGAALAWRDLGSGEVRLSLFDPSGGVRAGVESRVLGAAAGAPALAASEHALLVLWPDAESAGVIRRSAYDRVSDTFLHEGEVVLDADASRGGLHLAAAPADAFTAVYHRFSARELVDNEGQTPQGVSASALQIFARTLHVFDRDGDGLPPALDCDDGDAAIGAQTLVYVDRDGDGFGDADASGTLGCLGEVQSDGSVAVTNNDDCDDGEASVNPDAFETHANDIDENCDTRYACLDDIDGDGRVGLFDHDAPCGDTYPEVEIEDCDESNDAVYAGAQEIVGSGVDEDCDGQELCYADADGDGFGTAATVVSIDSDCDDFGESELDQDCDDTPGSGTAIQGPSPWYPDTDGDGYGDAGSAPLGTSCTMLAGAVDNNRDCDDSDAQRRPGAREICGDALDQDCDGFADRPECHIDACEGELGTEPELYQAGVREADPAYAPDPPPGLAIEGLYLAESEAQLAPLKNVHFSIDAESGEALLAGLFRVEALNAPGGGGSVGDVWSLNVIMEPATGCGEIPCAPEVPASLDVSAVAHRWRYYTPTTATLSSVELKNAENRFTYHHLLEPSSPGHTVQVGPSASGASLRCGLRFNFTHDSELRDPAIPEMSGQGDLVLDLGAKPGTEAVAVRGGGQ